jgi:predicted MPP superfamily phosphohydrolase
VRSHDKYHTYFSTDDLIINLITNSQQFDELNSKTSILNSKFLRRIVFITACLSMQIFSQAQFIPDHILNTENDSSKILIVGDTQGTSFWEFCREKNEGITKIVLDRMAKEKPEFIIHLGDVVTRGSSENSWKDFENAAENIRRDSIPIYPILGNHDYWGSNEDALQNFFDNFPYLKNKSWYSIKYNSIGIILLNSNFDDLTDEEIDEQRNWYAETIHKLDGDSSITAIIIACHHPPYTNSTVVNPDMDVQEYFTEPLRAVSKNPILFFSGHCHSYEHFYFGKAHYFVSGGGGGPRQKLETDPADIKYFDIFEGSKIREFHFFELLIINQALIVNLNYLDSKSNLWHKKEVVLFNF